MKYHKKLATLGVAAAALATATTAYGSGAIPYVFGHGGSGVPISASCQRKPVSIPLGKTWTEGKQGVTRVWTIQSAELKCLTKRVNKLADTQVKTPAPDTCWADAGAVPVVKQILGDDWTNVGELQVWIANLAACESAR